jgi:DNA-binding NarL/FixJ family response regulator
MAELGRILIADDEATFAEAHADLLRDQGYVCDCANDAHAAKALLAKNRYDLLIADIKMPGNDELEFIEELPAIAEGLPVILVTGYPTLNTAIQSTRLHVAGYMVKPLPLDDFLKLVRESILRSLSVRMFGKMRAHLQEMNRELASLSTMESLKSSSPSFVDTDVFLQFTIKNVIASMIDLRDLAQALAHNKPKQQVCQLLNCPRHAELTETIRDAIFVLEKTKSAFKSSELAALRLKLERVLGKSG